MKWSDIPKNIAINQQKMNWCKAIVLFLFLLFNLIIICIAALLIYISAHYYVTLHGYTGLLEDSAKNVVFLVIPLVIIIAVSLLLLLLALVGFIAGICQMKFLYGVYAIMLVVLLVIQVSGGVLIGVFEDPIKNSIAKGMEDNVHLYNETASIRKAYDDVQRDLKCCGVKNYTDWGENNLNIPQSCCKAETCDTCVMEDIYTEGCLLLVFRDAHEDGIITLTIIILFGLFQVTGLILSILLIFCGDDKGKKYESLKEGLPVY